MKEEIQQRFNFMVKWKASKNILTSDALSRSPVEDAPKSYNSRGHRSNTPYILLMTPNIDLLGSS